MDCCDSLLLRTYFIDFLKVRFAKKKKQALDISDIEDDDVPKLIECDINDEQRTIEAVNDDSSANQFANDDDINGVVNSEGDENTPLENENGVVFSMEQQNGNRNESNELEQQLADVQKQLQALSHLPSTIQATLEAVTKQIAEIMPAFRIRTSFDITGTVNEDSSVKLTEEFEAQQDIVKENENTKDSTDTEIITTESVSTDVTFKETSHAAMEISAKQTDEPLQNGKKSAKLQCNAYQDMTEILASNAEEQVTKLKIEQVFKEEERKWLLEREQAQKSIDEQKHMVAENAARNAKLGKLHNGPRTPQERPLILPGSRKWRNPKDAFNEEFIAEIISSQAELITGSTLGKYESPLLGYDDRINFLKYKKPEKDLSNLNRSEVLKLINNTDVGGVSGISERPEKLFAADDYVGHQ